MLFTLRREQFSAPMTIRMITAAAGPEFSAQPGDVLDETNVSAAMMHTLVAARYAQRIDSPSHDPRRSAAETAVANPARETAMTPTHRRRL